MEKAEFGDRFIQAEAKKYKKKPEGKVDAQRHKVCSKKHGHDTAVTTATLMKKKSSQEAGRSIRLEGSVSMGPPLTNVPTIVTVLITVKHHFK